MSADSWITVELTGLHPPEREILGDLLALGGSCRLEERDIESVSRAAFIRSIDRIGDSPSNLEILNRTWA